jgi:hypothetical protein
MSQVTHSLPPTLMRGLVIDSQLERIAFTAKDRATGKLADWAMPTKAQAKRRARREPDPSDVVMVAIRELQYVYRGPLTLEVPNSAD